MTTQQVGYDGSLPFRLMLLTRVGSYNLQQMNIMLKAVAGLRNSSLDLYHVSPECRQGHYHIWRKQLQQQQIWPFEKAVQCHSLSSLYDSLGALDITETTALCGCKNFDRHLPKRLQDIVCYKVMELL